MFVVTRVEFDWKTGAILSRDGYLYTGKAAFLKGSTPAQNELAASQTQFYNTLSSNYKTQFGNQSNILASLQGSLAPILEAGVNQYGFNPAEDVALRTQASEGTAAQFSNAAKSLGTTLSSEASGVGKFTPVAAGGETYIPSGGAGQLQEQLAVEGARAESNAQLGITEAGYAQGRQNYTTAANLLGGVAGQYNPIGYAGTADTAGTNAFGSDTTIQKANAAASPWGAISGILGGGLSAALGNPAGLSGIFGGGAGGGGGSDNPGVMCWVAAELYGGWYEPRTVVVRRWMTKHPAALFVYKRIGRWLAEFIRNHRMTRRAVKTLFDSILRQELRD